MLPGQTSLLGLKFIVLLQGCGSVHCGDEGHRPLTVSLSETQLGWLCPSAGVTGIPAFHGPDLGGAELSRGLSVQSKTKMFFLELE